MRASLARQRSEKLVEVYANWVPRERIITALICGRLNCQN